MKSCEDVRMALSAALDGEPESLDALRHVKLCAACAAYARELEGLDRQLHLVVGSPEPVPARFLDRLMARLPEARSLPAPEARAPDRAAALAGLALLGLVGAGALGQAGVSLATPFELLAALAGSVADLLVPWTQRIAGPLPALPDAGLSPEAALLALLAALALHQLAARGLRTGEA